MVMGNINPVYLHN